MNEINIFEKAVVGKYRFPYKGLITVEDLFDLSVEDLDSLFKTLNSQKKKDEEESLLSRKSKNDDILETKIKIVKNIVIRKLAEKTNKTLEIERKQQKQKIGQILAIKQEQDLMNKSSEELIAMMNQLG